MTDSRARSLLRKAAIPLCRIASLALGIFAISGLVDGGNPWTLVLPPVAVALFIGASVASTAATRKRTLANPNSPASLRVLGGYAIELIGWLGILTIAVAISAAFTEPPMQVLLQAATALLGIGLVAAILAAWLKARALRAAETAGRPS